MKHTITYLIEGRVLGQSDYECWTGPHNLVYICSTCGKEWARVFADTPSCWIAQSRPCRHHHPVGVWDWGVTPGSIRHYPGVVKRDLAVMWWGLAQEHLPLAVLLWEFQRELERYDRGLNEGP